MTSRHVIDLPVCDETGRLDLYVRLAGDVSASDDGEFCEATLLDVPVGLTEQQRERAREMLCDEARIDSMSNAIDAAEYLHD